MYKTQIPYLVKQISTVLIVVLSIKIAGYFCIVEDRTINQIFKVISRMGMTLTIILVYARLLILGCLSTYKFENLLPIVLYGMYLLLGLASFYWSSDVKYSILQWLMVFESLVFVMVFLQVINLINFHFPTYEISLIKVFSGAIFPIMVIFLLGAIVEPDLFFRGMRGGAEQRLGGYYMNPNELGMLASIGAAMSFLRLQQSTQKWGSILMLIAALIVLGLTASRSSAIGFLAIMGLLILKSGNKKLKLLMFLSVVLAIPFILKFVIFKDGGGVEEVLSMTGRIPFWTALLNEGIIREPFFGFGFMRINYTDYFESLNTYAAKMTHNTFMQVLMNLGFVGFFIAFWQLVTTLYTYLKVRKISIYSDFFIAMFIPVFVNSLTEFGIFGETNYGILFYQFLILLFVFNMRQRLSKEENYTLRLFQKRYDLNHNNIPL